jgi:hypothetical protein
MKPDLKLQRDLELVDRKSGQVVQHASSSQIPLFDFFGIPTNAIRLRRVKCDEGKPSCRRCIKFGVECQGYPLASKSETPSRAIIPKKFLQPLPWAVRPLNSGPSFDSEQELRYFRIFCNETARQIAGPFKVRS